MAGPADASKTSASASSKNNGNGDRIKEYLDVADVIFVVINADQRVSLINKRGANILGYSEKEVVGKNWFDTFLPTRLRDDVKTVFQNLIEGNVEPSEYYENPILTKNGEERIIAWHNGVLRDKSGKIISTISSGEDITDRKNAEIELKDALMKLEINIGQRYKSINASKTILRSNMTMWLIDGENYNAYLFDLLKVLSDMYNDILYISLSRPCQKVVTGLREKGGDPEKFRILCSGMEDHANGHEGLGEMEVTSLSIKIGEALGKRTPQAVVIDSFETMCSFMSKDTVVKFAQDLVMKLDSINCKGIFPMVASNRRSTLTGSLEVLMDEVVEVT